ncbi:MAG: response regulator [Gemmatimonadota bacterium]|nr:MAG: response regulator [Gemmatimonadota bacterium]
MADKKPLTTGEIARYCHVTHAGVIKWIKDGKLNAYATPGGHNRIPQKEFKNFLRRYNMPIDELFFSDPQKKILVVDDEPEIVDIITKTLKEDNKNYDFASAGDGYEAGRQVAMFKPDLIILDIKMPKMNGFEVCRQIKSNPDTATIKILGVTGFIEKGYMKKMLDSGADQCLSKPIRLEELKFQVKKLLGLTRRKEDVPS